eukprot:746719-Hanusia_phi.AAC.4
MQEAPIQLEEEEQQQEEEQEQLVQKKTSASKVLQRPSPSILKGLQGDAPQELRGKGTDDLQRRTLSSNV